ncbi:hypothetical protein [Archangium sp.]|jgi:hypothetical protein|uniref:hypothetical protein n=1 Tax=Archangium sp. TaxID=1872627 RepID=UPI002ED8F626
MNALVCALSLALLGATPTAELPREGRMLFEAAPDRLDARVGEWVTYQLEGSQQAFMRMAAVGEEKDAQGRDAVWLELEFGQHPAMKAPMAQFLMLVTRDVGLRTEGISRLFLTQGFERMQEVDQKALPALLGPPDKDSARPGPAPSSARIAAGPDMSVQRGKPARVMTLAGTVTAEPLEVLHKRTVLKRYWISREIPILRLAKMEFPGIRYSMEVRDHGVDAKQRMVLPVPGAKKITLEPASNLPDWMQPPPGSEPEPEENNP